jgi:hypothetical protein
LSFLTRFRRPPTQERTPGEGDLTTEPTADPAPDETAGDEVAGDEVAGDGAGKAGKKVKHPVVARVVTGLAGLIVLVALTAPNRINGFTPRVFVRIPVEGLLAVSVLLVLPTKLRRVAAALGGVGIGLVAILKMLDIGFYAVLVRPFDPVLDWALLADGFSFLKDSIGRSAAIGTLVASVVLVIVVLVVVTLSVLRVTRFLVRHDGTTRRTVAALAAAWVACALLGVQIVPGVPVASDSDATLAYRKARLVRTSLHDMQTFTAQAGVDPFRNTPGDKLLTGLRGKDVMIAFVESYGRTAVQNPQVGAMLDAGTRQLQAAGFASRSGWLTSPTTTGASWLAHSTLLSGLWINNQERYRNLVSSNRLTLTRAFQRANWRTVGVEPGVTQAWPEGVFYGYDRVFDSHNIGYNGPKFSWATMPDQYALSAFEHSEYGRANRGPLMAEVTLVSSHSPWAPIPFQVDWNAVGDGSIFNAIEKSAAQPGTVWRSTNRVRAEYARSIEYSVNSLVSYVETYGKDNLVLVFLGDHQPAPVIVGPNASWDVPITIVAHDPGVLNRISGWGWQDGLKPGAQSPVWRMDTFRDRFLTAFGPQPGITQSSSPPAR